MKLLFMLFAGANVNLQSRNRQTALIVAVSTVSLECVDILIDAGAHQHYGLILQGHLVV